MPKVSYANKGGGMLNALVRKINSSSSFRGDEEE
jgi:hypothetical protein